MVGVVIDIVAPIFGVVICGFIAGHVRLLDKAAIRGISIYVFNLAIPLLLFYAMAKMDLPDVLPWSYLLAYYGCALGFFAVAFTLSGLVFKYVLGRPVYLRLAAVTAVSFHLAFLWC